MVITTLERIHSLLKAEKERCEEDCRAARAAIREIYEDDPRFPELNKRCDDTFCALSAVRDALEDFENHEW